MNRRAAHDSHADAAWLTDALREQAGQHEADPRRIQASFERLTAAAAEPTRTRSRRFVRLTRLTRLRLIGVPLGVLAVAATATVAVGVSLGITARSPHPQSQAAPPSSPRATATGYQPLPQSTLSPPRPAGSASSHTESSPIAPSGPTAGPLAAAGTVDSHSNPYWAQEDLTVTTTRAIHALHAVVTVSGGANVRSTGSWATLPAAAITVTANQTAGGLVYDISLKPGQTLQPGTYAFGLQFDRGTGHDFSQDSYTVTSDAAQTSATGTFSN